MNGYVLFHLLMFAICLYNFISISNNPYAPTWSKFLVFFLTLIPAFFAALYWGFPSNPWNG